MVMALGRAAALADTGAGRLEAIAHDAPALRIQRHDLRLAHAATAQGRSRGRQRLAVCRRLQKRARAVVMRIDGHAQEPHFADADALAATRLHAGICEFGLHAGHAGLFGRLRRRRARPSRDERERKEPHADANPGWGSRQLSFDIDSHDFTHTLGVPQRQTPNRANPASTRDKVNENLCRNIVMSAALRLPVLTKRAFYCPFYGVIADRDGIGRAGWRR